MLDKKDLVQLYYLVVDIDFVIEDYTVDMAELYVQSLLKKHLVQKTKLPRLILKNIVINLVQWKYEDKTRDTRSSDLEIAGIKKSIDYLNQRRNDCIENINEAIHESVIDQMNVSGNLFSETPGSVLDRLSIIHIRKMYLEKYMEKNKNINCFPEKIKLKNINSQIEDLFQALNTMFEEIFKGNWYYKLYYQHKLYNDAKYNTFLNQSPRMQ